MNRIFIPLSLCIVLSILQGTAQNKLARSVYLVGNASNVSCDAPIMLGLRNLTATENAPFVVLYTGDIIDDDGLEKDHCENEWEKLRGLIEIAKNNPLGEVLFIPGEKDWDNAGEAGYQKIKRLEDFLESALKTKRALVPTKGCPGPMVLDFGDDLRIIAVNTQWFLHPYQKPGESDVDCDMYDVGEFWDELDDYMEEVPTRNIIVAGHHPAFSYGQYAGYKNLRKHLFPLTDVWPRLYIPIPGFGSFYADYRLNVGTVKDLTNQEMKTYSHRLKQVFRQYEHVIYAAAHELDLQVQYVDRNFHINSGAMGKTRAVGKGPETRFSSSEQGFIKLEYYRDGAVRMKVYGVRAGKLALSHDQLLMASACAEPVKEIPINYRYAPCQDTLSGDTILLQPTPAVTITAPGPQYEVGKLRRWVFGEHYRNTWAAKVEVPVLNLDTTFGGLTPFAEGGGGQTYVLKFQAGDGEWYYFRSVDKDPSMSLTHDARLIKGWYGAMIRDLTSGQYPYGALVADKLMDAANIQHANPRLYVMPDHPKLGVYRKKFGGITGMLELRPRGKNKGVAGFYQADKVVKTVRMFQRLLEDHDNKAIAESYAKARLLDILIGDWDRQADNWKFMGYGDKDAMTFYAMPKDRDRAFSKWEGIYWLFDREFASPRIAHFGYRYRGIQSLTYKARNIDRMLLNELTWEQWRDLAGNLQKELPDAIIDEAVAAIPAGAKPSSGQELTEKLKSRRDRLLEATHIYYRQLAKYVHVVGSNKREIFEVERLPEGDVQIEVYKKKKTGEKDKLLYHRNLRKGETKEIRLFGLDGEDEFLLTGEAGKSILVRIVSGDGADLVQDQSRVKGWKKYTRVYDKSGADTLRLANESRLVHTKEPIRFTYQMYEPNSYLPMPAFIYNQDDGFGLGFSLSLKRHGFNKPKYASKYNFSLAGTTRENFWMKAAADYRHTWMHWDLLWEVELTNSERAFQHFYGTGNNSIKDDSLSALDFYRNHADKQLLGVALKRDFWRKSYFKSGIVFERYDVTSLGVPDKTPSIYDALEGLQGMGVHAYLGNQLELNLDFTDANNLPKRGSLLKLSHQYSFDLTEQDSRFGRFEADLRFYETIRTAIPVTLGLRTGFIHTYGKVPFYYLGRLGQKDNLRGYLRNRFTGDQAVFLNTDLRFDLGTIETVAVPIGIGVIGFADAGKVFTTGENSGNWHLGYGTGFYLSPVNDNFNITFSGATSKEEKFLFELGFGFKL